MIAKVFEVRDEQQRSFHVLATRMAGGNAVETAELDRAGVRCGVNAILVLRLDTHDTAWKPESWEDRALRVAHQHLYDRWFDLGSGATLDVQALGQ